MLLPLGASTLSTLQFLSDCLIQCKVGYITEILCVASMHWRGDRKVEETGGSRGNSGYGVEKKRRKCGVGGETDWGTGVPLYLFLRALRAIASEQVKYCIQAQIILQSKVLSTIMHMRGVRDGRGGRDGNGTGKKKQES